VDASPKKGIVILKKKLRNLISLAILRRMCLINITCIRETAYGLNDCAFNF